MRKRGYCSQLRVEDRYGGSGGGLFLLQSRIIGASLLAYMHRGKFCRRGSVLAMLNLDSEREVGPSWPASKDWIIDGVEENDLIVNFCWKSGRLQIDLDPVGPD